MFIYSHFDTHFALADDSCLTLSIASHSPLGDVFVIGEREDATYSTSLHNGLSGLLQLLHRLEATFSFSTLAQGLHISLGFADPLT